MVRVRFGIPDMTRELPLQTKHLNLTSVSPRRGCLRCAVEGVESSWREMDCHPHVTLSRAHDHLPEHDPSLVGAA